jgi:outer membrane protein assembly factor BamE
MLTKLTRTINAMQRLSILLALCLLISLSGCSHYKFPWVYRIDVEQGNVLEEEKVAQLKVGMTQNQVKFLLGSPIIRDTFNQERWDYIYSMRTGKGKLDRERVTLTFQGDTLANIEKQKYETKHLNY